MQDSRIAPRLVRGKVILFFQNDDLLRGVLAGEIKSGGKSYDATADDNYV
jgi:hypothetical protein